MNKRPPTAKRGGRAKGTPNKRTSALLRQVNEILQGLGFDPIEAMVRVAMGDVVGCGFMTKEDVARPARRVVGDDGLIWHKPSGKERALEILSPRLRFEAAKELATYMYPKRHSVAHTDPNGNAINTGASVVVMLPSNGR